MKKEAFKVIGIQVRTTNENEESAQDIPALFNQFISGNVMEQIPGKLSHSVYFVYTDYEGGFMQPYTCIIGCRVDSLSNVPEGMVGKVVEEGEFTTFAAKGDQVGAKWGEIWSMDAKLDRSYTSDYDLYENLGEDFSKIDVTIHVAVN